MAWAAFAFAGRMVEVADTRESSVQPSVQHLIPPMSPGYRQHCKALQVVFISLFLLRQEQGQELRMHVVFVSLAGLAVFPAAQHDHLQVSLTSYDSQ